MSDKLNKVQAFITNYHNFKMREISVERGVSFTKLISYAIDNELLKDRPFDFDCTLPDISEYEEFSFAEEGGLIIDFMRGLNRAIELDSLVLLRFEIGIKDRETFLLAFKECLRVDVIEVDRSKKGKVLYRIKGTKKSAEKSRKEASEYNRYLKLKRKYENEA